MATHVWLKTVASEKDTHTSTHTKIPLNSINRKKSFSKRKICAPAIATGLIFKQRAIYSGYMKKMAWC